MIWRYYWLKHRIMFVPWLISSRSGWWVWHIIPNRFCISWRFYQDAYETEPEKTETR